MVPLSAQVPISAPTASRMKMAESPAATPSIVAWRNPDHGMPFLVATPPAIRAAKTKATWLGPCAAFSP